MSPSSHPTYRIGIDARFFRRATAGLGRYTRELIYALARLDQYNEYVIFLTPTDLPEWDLTQENFRPVVVDAPHYTFAEQTTFLRTLYRENLDLVHFLNFNHPLLYRRPFVATLQDFTVYYHPVGRSQKSWMRRQAFILTLRHSLTAARRVIAISENSAKDAGKIFNIPQAKMEVIYEGGPDPQQAREAIPFGSKVRVQEYLGSKKPYFLFVSQWRSHKGLVTLIDAFSRFKEKTGFPHQLVLLGNQKTSLQEVKAALERSPFVADILTPGFAPDELLPSLYHHTSAYVLPSEYEGFGLTVLEAFAYGAPVIVANNSSLPEVAGDAALYFPTRDPSALAVRMEEIVISETVAQSLVEKGWLQLAKFSWEKCARETLKTYLAVLEKKR